MTRKPGRPAVPASERVLLEETLDKIWGMANPTSTYFDDAAKCHVIEFSNRRYIELRYAGPLRWRIRADVNADEARIVLGRRNAIFVKEADLPTICCEISQLDSPVDDCKRWFLSSDDEVELATLNACEEDPVVAYIEDRNKQFPMWDWI